MEVSAIMECWDESRIVSCLLISTCSRLDGCLGFSEKQRVEASDTQTCLLYMLDLRSPQSERGQAPPPPH